MKYSTEIALCGMIYIPCLLKTGTGFQALLRFFLSNLGCCNVGITDGGDL
jgi:hypothetical protein